MFEPPTMIQLNQNMRHWASVSPHSNLVSNPTAIYTRVNETGRPPRKLPSGTFLICGDRAWKGIPASPHGRPCYLGKLTLFHPNLHQWLNLTNHASYRRARRSVHELECPKNDPPIFWNRGMIWLASFFTPQVAAGRSLHLLQKVAYWARNELNITSQMLDELSADVVSVRHGVLQNRAAIDFLLLAQGHGCEDFEGMCYINLSDHSESIHKNLQQLKKKVCTTW